MEFYITFIFYVIKFHIFVSYPPPQRLQTRSFPAFFAASTVPDIIYFERERVEHLSVVCQTFPLSTQYTVPVFLSKLEVMYTNLKMARTISIHDKDINDTKQRLSRLVREVDKCIALLNE